MKDNLYFLTIHKNGNRVIKDKVINKISNSLTDIPIYVGNKGWTPVTDNTFILSTFRHPVLRTISHFCDYKKNILNDYSKPDIKEFAQWFDNNQQALTNYQLKNLFYMPDSEKDLLTDNEFKELELPQKMSDVKNRIRRIDCLVRVDNIRNETLLNISQTILKEFKRDLVPYHPEPMQYNINIFSRQLAMSLPEKIKSHIEYINDLEMNIYSTDSLFNKYLV